MIQTLKTIALCCMISLCSCAINAQSNIVKVEYYIDIDPGYDNGTPVSISQGTDLANLTVLVDPSSLSSGTHLLGIRAKDAKGAWSIDNKWLFVKNAAEAAKTKIINAEYYIDVDPGYGNASAINILSDTNLINLITNINPATLTTGVHLFGIRAKDGNGAWSLDNKWLFVKNSEGATAPKIINAEYYIDVDPGYGNATSITISSDTNLINLPTNINPATLTTGVHLFGIRAKDANGSWSLDNKWLFVKNAAMLDTPNIVRVEYYIDNDPGYGKGYSANISPLKNLADLMQNVNIPALGNGAHFIAIRALDANGGWSLDNKLSFIVNGPLPITFTNFTGRYTNKVNELTVEIQQALNVKVVQVEKSLDGTHFTYVGDMVTAPVTAGTYKYDDKNPLQQITFYRLGIIDVDGRISYSYVVTIQHTSAFEIQVYPNPVLDNLIVHFENAIAGTYSIRLTDGQGKTMLTHKVSISQDTQNGDVNIAFGIYSAGIYFMQVTDKLNKVVTIQKIIKK